MEVEIGRELFNSCYLPMLEDYTDTQIIFGGAASGKSRFLAQRYVIWMMDGRSVLVSRKVAGTLRSSCFAEMAGCIAEWGLGNLFAVQKSTGTITCCANNAQAIFVGLDNVEKIKSIRPLSGVFDDVWVEEATEITYQDYRQLRLRQRGKEKSGDNPKTFTMSFNPILQSHWINQRVMIPAGWTNDKKELKTKDISFLKTTYLDNRFLTVQDQERLQNETDKYWRDVYVMGYWGVLGNVIFNNWEVADLSSMRDQFTNLRIGLDFGFASDPAALVMMHYDQMRKIIYIFGEWCQTGVQNDELAAVIKELVGYEMVMCDSAEPKSIAELKARGVNAYPVRKGQDSVNYGIQWLKQHRIVVDSACINAQNELSGYKWREDAAGNVSNPPRPVSKDDHIIDAIRYGLENDMRAIATGGKARQWKG